MVAQNKIMPHNQCANDSFNEDVQVESPSDYHTAQQDYHEEGCFADSSHLDEESFAMNTDEGDEDSQAGSLAFSPNSPPFTPSD